MEKANAFFSSQLAHGTTYALSAELGQETSQRDVLAILHGISPPL
jgi:hypothetical protein